MQGRWLVGPEVTALRRRLACHGAAALGWIHYVAYFIIITYLTYLKLT